MARIFITGSTDLGRAAARTLIDEGHQVGSAVETRSIAAQVNALRWARAVFHRCLVL